MKKAIVIALAVLFVAAQSLAACTIFAVGKNATVDGSTMTSHTCDSTGDDLRLWVIPEMEAGFERDVVVDGRAGVDYSNFPNNMDYGMGAVVGSYTFEQPTNQYIHAMYSFINDKGLAMGESTCSKNTGIDQGKKVAAAFKDREGDYDCYMLQDLALEVCSTAREAVEFMGKMITEYGWYGSTECINICDGNEAWVLEAYGANYWVAARVPDDMVFVAANRARINFWKEDCEDYLSAPGIKEFAKENGLWDGESEFIPCYTFAPYPYRPYSTLREWRAMTLLDPSLELDPLEKDTDHNWPCFVKPAEPVSVATIKSICSDYYQGTEFDVSETIWGGQFGDPLNPAQDFTNRAINSYRCTYIQIAQVNASLPEEVRCLAWFGYGAPSVAYLTPIFASVNSLPEAMNHGLRSEYDPSTGWWNSLTVQQLARINYKSAIQDIKAVRDAKQEELYALTAQVQDLAASMIEVGMTDAAVKYLTAYTANCFNEWFDAYAALADKLLGKYMLGGVNMGTWGLKYTDFWNQLSASDWYAEHSIWSTI